jgi:hypothetical protein
LPWPVEFHVGEECESHISEDNASTAYPTTEKAIEVTCFAYGDKLYHVYLAINIPDVNNAMIPEKWKSSVIQYERYPKTNIILHSITGLTVKNLQFLRSIELQTPQSSPMNIEKNANVMNDPITLKGVVDVNSLLGPAYSYTVLKRIIHTASFVIPSPNTRENSFGCSSYLIIETAATTSVQHNNEHINKISIVDSVNYSYSLY